MGEVKVVIESAYYIKGLNLTKEEQEQETAKFKAWYENYMRAYGREPQKWE